MTTTARPAETLPEQRRPALDELEAALRGPLALPGSEAYDRLTAAFNAAVAVRPLAVVDAADAYDVATAVRIAGRSGLRVAVQRTGHGAVAVDGALLVHTGRLDECLVSADGWARVGAGVLWSTVVEAAAPLGLAPLSGSEVGVGMPVIVRFDLPVERKAAFEKQLSVESSPQVSGTWHWVSDTEVHYRPKTFWEPGTEVRVEADVNSVPAGNGIYGQESRSGSFTIGDSVISHVNLRTNQMRVKINGKLARTIPITGGKAGFESRSGTKVIVEKFVEKRMDAATTGIAPGNPEYYNIADVQYAMRVTYTGEFLHAAPWSVDSQGSANVSHGCIGMSTEDARWLFERSSIGDVVITTGSDREIEYGNGYTDWDISYAEYQEKSALS